MTGAERIAWERARQVQEEGRTPEHDDGHDGQELAMAAATYLLCSDIERVNLSALGHELWPWAPDSPKVTGDRITNLVKAGALIAAEIDRLDRASMAWICTCGHWAWAHDRTEVRNNPAVYPCAECGCPDVRTQR
jgi:hypothetical protein